MSPSSCPLEGEPDTALAHCWESKEQEWFLQEKSNKAQGRSLGSGAINGRRSTDDFQPWAGLHHTKACSVVLRHAHMSREPSFRPKSWESLHVDKTHTPGKGCRRRLPATSPFSALLPSPPSPAGSLPQQAASCSEPSPSGTMQNRLLGQAETGPCWSPGAGGELWAEHGVLPMRTDTGDTQARQEALPVTVPEPGLKTSCPAPVGICRRLSIHQGAQGCGKGEKRSAGGWFWGLTLLCEAPLRVSRGCACAYGSAQLRGARASEIAVAVVCADKVRADIPIQFQL